MLPLEKALVESLFQDNLLRVVFATETLAAGMLPSYHPSPRRPSPQASTCPHHTSLMFPSYHPSPSPMAGINMPARSTVVSVLSKRGSRGIEPLSATQVCYLVITPRHRATLRHAGVLPSYHPSASSHSPPRRCRHGIGMV